MAGVNVAAVMRFETKRTCVEEASGSDGLQVVKIANIAHFLKSFCAFES